MKWKKINEFTIESDDGTVRVTRTKIGDKWIYTRFTLGDWYCWKWTPTLITDKADEAKK